MGAGQYLLIVLRPFSIRPLVAAAFVLPAASEGFHAADGTIKHTIPSETWLILCSVMGGLLRRSQRF